MTIECRRGGPNAPWEEVGITTASPWFDKRPLLDPARPEVRENRLRYWDKGEANGDWTVVSKITVSPQAASSRRGKVAARCHLRFLRIVFLPKLRSGLVGAVSGFRILPVADALNPGRSAEELEVLRA